MKQVLTNSDLTQEQTYYLPARIQMTTRSSGKWNGDKDYVTVTIDNGVSGSCTVYTESLLKKEDIND
jgi:hypothetical protein